MMFVPETFKNIEIAVASVTKVLFGTPYPIKLEPREFGDLLQAELRTKLLDYDLE